MKRISLALAFVALVGAACGSEDTGSTAPEDGGAATQVEITAADFAFSPTSISADAGQEIEVTLINDDDTEHSFTIDNVVDFEAAGGEEASDSFTAPDATVEFYCRYHPDMRGEVSIGGSAGADTGGGATMDDDNLDY